MKSLSNHPDLVGLHNALVNHTMYKKILTISDLKLMMETHVFAVWDFMSLLKRLQRDITCVELPWKPSQYPKSLVRLINEIVLVEESDLDQNGQAVDHFSLYLKAMNELGAKSAHFDKFMLDMDTKTLTAAQAQFVDFNLSLAKNGAIHEVAAAFFFGREKLIPDMFNSILDDLKANIDQSNHSKFANLRFYLERHIEVDGDEHSHLAEECLSVLCGNDDQKWQQALSVGLKALKLRSALWDDVESRLN